MKQSKYIEPLYMDGLQGRMLRIPGEKGAKREFLMVGGHHTSLERMYGFVEYMSRFGNVTMPDLPGFGGMTPLYRLNIQPNIDSFADYMAAFIKLRYKKKKVTLVGFSYSLPVFIRMLQKYPELTRKVDCMVSVVGFVHHEDFRLPRWQVMALRILGVVGAVRPISAFLKLFIVRSWLIRLIYAIRANSHSKVKDASPEERKKRVDMEVRLWLDNDLRTWFETMNEMMQINVCDGKLPLTVYHIATEQDTYFNNEVITQHLNIIFEKVHTYKIKHGTHAPSVVASADDAAPFFPKQLQKVFKVG